MCVCMTEYLSFKIPITYYMTEYISDFNHFKVLPGKEIKSILAVGC